MLFGPMLFELEPVNSPIVQVICWLGSDGVMAATACGQYFNIAKSAHGQRPVVRSLPVNVTVSPHASNVCPSAVQHPVTFTLRNAKNWSDVSGKEGMALYSTTFPLYSHSLYGKQGPVMLTCALIAEYVTKTCLFRPSDSPMSPSACQKGSDKVPSIWEGTCGQPCVLTLLLVLNCTTREGMLSFSGKQH